MAIFLREVLSAPTSDADMRIQNTVILVVSTLSAIGAGCIIASFLASRTLRTFRHQLILGLAISDFWMAVNFMTSTSVNLSGSKPHSAARDGFCSYNGFMTQLFVVQTDYWVFIIAAYTFLVLADYKCSSSWIQDHRIVLWTLPWFFSTLWAAIGLGVVGYYDIGSWCWFTSDKVRLLVNFVPRWIIIITILGLYLRLYFLLRKAHTRFMSFDDETSGIVELSTSRSENHAAQDSSSYISPSANESCEQGGGTRHIRTRHQLPVLKKISYQMVTYPLVYLLIWAIPTSIRIYQAVTGNPAPFSIATVDKVCNAVLLFVKSIACIVIQGLADAIVYGLNESKWRAWACLSLRRTSIRRTSK